MVTRSDITTNRQFVDPLDSTVWVECSYKNQHFLMCAVDMKDQDIDRVVETAMPFSLISVLAGPEIAREEFINTFPIRETAVFPAVVGKDGKYQMKYECNEECKTGVCKKRLASREDVGDIDVAYNMLVDALNA